MPDRTVALLIPAYNAGAWLADAIESALGQRHCHEIVVIDDGSEDATADVARGYAPAVRLLRQEHAGTGVARNLGVAATDAAVVAFLDADDRFTAAGLDLRVDFLLDHPECDLVFGQSRRFELTREDGPVPSGPLEPCALPGAAVIRRPALERIGPFRESAVADALDWLLRARELPIREAVLPEQVLWRRVHGGNTSRTDYREYARALKASLDRRRATATVELPAG